MRKSGCREIRKPCLKSYMPGFEFRAFGYESKVNSTISRLVLPKKKARDRGLLIEKTKPRIPISVRKLFGPWDTIFVLIWPPCGMWSSQARYQVWAAVATYTAAAAMLDPLTCCAGLGIEPASWRCRDTVYPIVPQQELHDILVSQNVV